MSTTNGSGASVLVTGCTGFVGKVVLEGLVRRRAELGIRRIYVLIRPSVGRDAAQRFQEEVVASPCFSRLAPGWEASCEPVSGDVIGEGLDLTPAVRDRLWGEVTHVIHCAASVAFDLPLAEAARINVTGALNVQAFAKGCTHLRSLVDVSTAYVTPHPGNDVPVEEAPVPFPLDPAEVYRSIQEGTADEEALLARTGHPNTYTFTKCLAELMLAEEQAGLPLTIVRPSIVAACVGHPFPGWIDSRAAFAGFVVLFALGHLRAVCARPQTVLDIVPCDHVAATIIACAFGPPPDPRRPAIRHAVAGLANSASIAEIARALESHYRARPIASGARLRYLGSRSLRWRLAHWRHHQLPLRAGAWWLALRGRDARAGKAKKLLGVLDELSQTFAYFTHHTYHFRSSMQAPQTDQYVGTVASGVSQHLLKRDPEQVPLAGLARGATRQRRDDVRWTLRQPHGNAVVRTLGWGLRKALRLGTEEVTYDEASFQAALAHVRPGDLVVMVPSHRSYMDFMVCSMLCFAHPELGLRPPRIAATEDFACVPVVGWVMRKGGAFFIKRGLGREDPTLTRQIQELAAARDPLKFFIEGTRSRGRRFLEPRRGVLRALQQTGQPCVLLPIAINHDRTAEDESFLRELRGGSKPKNRLKPLLGWLSRLRQGHVRLGPVHLRCGTPQRLGAESDPRAVAHALTAELQRSTTTTTHHLHAFERAHPESGVDAGWLREAIERRGGRVIESAEAPAAPMDPVLERCYQGHWIHLFYADALAHAPDNAAVAHHVRRNGFWYPEPPPDDPDPRLSALLDALFAPVCRDYQAVAAAVEAYEGEGAITGKGLVARLDGAFLPDVEGALADLAERGYLEKAEKGYRPTGRTDGLAAYRSAAAWQPLALEAVA
jgi:alcohol-forming fatty acyl-CoA reductase